MPILSHNPWQLGTAGGASDSLRAVAPLLWAASIHGSPGNLLRVLGSGRHNMATSRFCRGAASPRSVTTLTVGFGGGNACKWPLTSQGNIATMPIGCDDTVDMAQTADDMSDDNMHMRMHMLSFIIRSALPKAGRVGWIML